MTRAEAMLNRLACGIAASATVLIVVAHPDDEAISLGGAMGLLHHAAATVIQVTDGGVDLPRLWAGVGATSCAEYAAVRRAERDRAWKVAKWRFWLQEIGLPDRQTHLHIGMLIERVRLAMTPDVDVVFTHPYEGGHPDHDACAFAVQAACDRLGSAAPERVEFASYHWNRRRVMGQFYPAAGYEIRWATVEGKRLDRKRAAIAAYASQRQILRWFPPERECYRLAPRYDFTQAPPPPECLYERRGLPMTQAEWRAAIARAA